MQLIYFSKEFRKQTIPQLIEVLYTLRCDGVDLCVRPGYAVNPDNAVKELPRAAKMIREAGLTIPMISAPTDLTDSHSPAAQNLLLACHDANIPLMKPGYWPYDGAAGDYWKQVDTVRKEMEAWTQKAQTLGVKVCPHTHSGYNMGLNASAMMQLVRGLNPAHIGVYLDTAHLSLYGEPLPMAIDIAANYLSIVAVKDVLWIRHPDKARTSESVPLGEGLADFTGMVKALKTRGFAGPITLHTEYNVASEQERLDKAIKDMAFMRKRLAE